MNDKEKMIQEQRLNQATKDEMMGSAGKLGMIAKWLGSPIINQTGGLYEIRYLADPWKLPNDELPIAEDDNITYEGYIFDGLSRGIHLEIKYDNNENKLSATYKGYTVYTEIAGDLYSYAPFDEWISAINKLYKQAVLKQKKYIEENKLEDIKALKEQQMTFLQKLRMRWGI